jgi:hypothetical protein
MPRKAAAGRKSKPKAKADKRRGDAGKKNLIPFKKGERRVGRQKGTLNKTTTLLKDAILKAAELLGRDGRGKNGTVGYLMWLARAEPAVYGRMLEKILPHQLEMKDTTEKKLYTAEEAKAALEERGLPVPQSLASLAENVVRRHDDDEDVDNSEFEDLAPDTPEIYSEDELEENEDDTDDEAPPDEEAA